MTMQLAAEAVSLAGLIPGAKPTPVPGLSGPVSQFFGYGLWVLIIAGAGAVGFGVFKLNTTPKGRHGEASEPFKWMAAGAASIILSGSLIAILNGLAG